MVAVAVTLGRRTPLWAVWALLAVTLAATPAFAIDSAGRSAARQLAEEGVAAYQAEDYATAHNRLERAYETLPTAPLALWSARALEKVGRWVEASERYLQATRIPLDPKGDAAVQEKARQDATAERERLKLQIPSLVVEVTGASSEVVVHVGERQLEASLLGADLPVDPGNLQVTATLGSAVVTREVHLEAGEHKTVHLDFSGKSGTSTEEATRASTADAASGVEQDRSHGSWHRPVAWTSIGLGAAGLALGAAFGVDAIAKRDASASDCNADDVCGSDGTELRHAGLTSATISTTAFAVGAALAATGVVLLITAPRREAPSMAFEAVPTLGGGLVYWRGRF